MLNAVIDISHHNGLHLDFTAAKAAGVLAVIHKATQGAGGSDPMYEANRTNARAAGMLWGAYHFATGSDPIMQADNFLNKVGDTSDTLLVLDYEPNISGATMNLAQARAFVTHIKNETGRWPGLYSGNLIKETLGNQKDPVLVNCWLWLAQYGPKAVVPSNWSTWTLWQYTDGSIGEGPHDVPGIGHCDRDQFNGDEAGLRRLWGVA